VEVIDASFRDRVGKITSTNRHYIYRATAKLNVTALTDQRDPGHLIAQCAHRFAPERVLLQYAVDGRPVMNAYFSRKRVSSVQQISGNVPLS
jgi:hypothetical protein